MNHKCLIYIWVVFLKIWWRIDFSGPFLPISGWEPFNISKWSHDGSLRVVIFYDFRGISTKNGVLEAECIMSKMISILVLLNNFIELKMGYCLMNQSLWHAWKWSQTVDDNLFNRCYNRVTHPCDPTYHATTLLCSIFPRSFRLVYLHKTIVATWNNPL